MSEQLSTEQFLQFLDKRLILSALPMFNRLEGRPRTHDFDKALRAEVRDALWMLTKQWQMGEFKGDDAGSPVSSKVCLEKTMLTKYQPGQHTAEAFDDSVPLETKVEQRKIPFQAGDLETSLDLRLLMGRQWSKLLHKNGLNQFKSKYIENFPIYKRKDIERNDVYFYEPNPDFRGDLYYCGSVQSWRKYAATATRHIDGKKLYDDIVADSGNHVNTVEAEPELHGSLIKLGERFIKWFDKLFYQPKGDVVKDAWLPSKLEYQFSCSAPNNSGEKVFTSEEYYHGHLDWYNFSIETKTAGLGDVEPSILPEDLDSPIIRSFIPTPVQFDGMPNSRWWAFEEGQTNFGDIQPDTTDINKLLLIEFGLVYANDWYLVPFTLPAGAIASIRGMSVKNVFGENLWITATGRGLDDDPNRWTMYSMDVAGNNRQPADLSMMIAPSVPKIQEGKSLEEIMLVRDEVANMVWGIETRIPLPSGESVPGLEAARDTQRYLKRIKGCVLKIILVNNENDEQSLITQFKAEFISKKDICAVLIVAVTINAQNRWTIAGFNDAGEFKIIVIDDVKDKLSTELNKADRDEDKIIELAISYLGTKPPVADLRYKIMSSVPENWIPFIATHEADSNREARLQRGSMPRFIVGDPQKTIEKVKPRTNLLREGLNQAIKQSYFINEEEVLRAGINVSQSFQRTRWYSGQVYNWLGVRKRTGRGEASSQLRYDYLQPVKKVEHE